MFQKIAKRPVKRVLDLACGTGGPTLELRKRGYDVVGVDVHREVVEIARRKAKKLGLDTEFLVCDARRIDEVFPEDFLDAVTVFFSSITYMTRINDLKRLLEAIKHVLKSGGIFIADSPNPYEFMFKLGREGGERKCTIWNVKHDMKNENIVLTDWREIIDWTNCIIEFKRIINIVKKNGENRVYVVNDKLRLYSANEFEFIARSIGFNEAKTLCYSRGTFTERSTSNKCSRLIFIVVA